MGGYVRIDRIIGFISAGGPDSGAGRAARPVSRSLAYRASAVWTSSPGRSAFS
jgi:hypothetical protein